MINLVLKHEKVAPKVRVFLDTVGSDIRVNIEDDQGNENALLKICSDGTIYLYSDVDPKFGFKLDSDGHVIINE